MTEPRIPDYEAYFRLRTYLETGRSRGRPLGPIADLREAIEAAVAALRERLDRQGATASRHESSETSAPPWAEMLPAQGVVDHAAGHVTVHFDPPRELYEPDPDPED